MIVVGNKVYLLTPPWDMVSLLGDRCPLSAGEEGAGRQPRSRLEEALNLSSSDAVTKEVPAGLAETERDVPPDAGAMSFHTETLSIGPQRLKRTEVIDIASSGS